VWLIATLPYVSAGPAKGSAVASAGVTQAVVATGWTLALWTGLWAVGLTGVVQAAVLVAVAASGTWWLARLFMRRAGGITGDFLGATEQVLECAAWLALLAVVASVYPPG
jgi:adenosylcobinamide-GDP ribazoletransferase